MEFIQTALVFLLVSSVALNVFLFKKSKLKDKSRKESYELIEFVHDLSNGRGLIEVRRISPLDVFLRSPKEL